MASNSHKKLIWVNILFFAATTLIGLVGAPLYFFTYGVSSFEIALTVFYIVMTGLSITAGYHRLYSHRTYNASPLVEFFVLFFGAAAFEQSALSWSSQHRDHHRYVDTDKDPYSIKKGFFYAHIGWLLFWEHHIDYDNAKDLQKNKMVANQHRHYYLWSAIAGIAVPVLIGAFFGHALGAFIFAVCLRLAFVHHSTFCINSVCHTFGKPTYDIHSTAKDHWFVAFLTNGEGYHNFHHRFSGDYRNGVRWYQWDPSKWTICLLSWLGLAKDLKTVSKFTILEARLSAEIQLISEKLDQMANHPLRPKIGELVQGKYAHLLQTLSAWEASKKEYQLLLIKQMSERSDELMRVASRNIANARVQFEAHHRQWVSWVRLGPTDLVAIAS